jgi:hypothetical protein
VVHLLHTRAAVGVNRPTALALLAVLEAVVLELAHLVMERLARQIQAAVAGQVVQLVQVVQVL